MIRGLLEVSINNNEFLKMYDAIYGYMYRETLWELNIGHYRNVRGLGKSMVVFRLFEKLRYSQMKDQLYCRVLTTNRSIWRRKISPKIESLYGLGRQARKL